MDYTKLKYSSDVLARKSALNFIIRLEIYTFCHKACVIKLMTHGTFTAKETAQERHKINSIIKLINWNWSVKVSRKQSCFAILSRKNNNAYVNTGKTLEFVRAFPEPRPIRNRNATLSPAHTSLRHHIFARVSH
jgi:hypothetical protein